MGVVSHGTTPLHPNRQTKADLVGSRHARDPVSRLLGRAFLTGTEDNLAPGTGIGILTYLICEHSYVYTYCYDTVVAWMLVTQWRGSPR